MSHLQSLEKKHTDLDQAILQAEKSPGSDPMTIRQMKSQKLRLKDKIVTLRSDKKPLSVS